MMQFDGDQAFSLSPAELFAKLRDARFLLDCVPDVEEVTLSDLDSAVFRIKPGFSFVRGSLDITLKVMEATDPTSIRYLVHGKGIGASNDVEAALAISANGSGASVRWTAEVKNLTGLLKMVPKGLIKASAQKVILDMWGIIGSKL